MHRHAKSTLLLNFLLLTRFQRGFLVPEDPDDAPETRLESVFDSLGHHICPLGLFSGHVLRDLKKVSGGIHESTLLLQVHYLVLIEDDESVAEKELLSLLNDLLGLYSHFEALVDVELDGMLDSIIVLKTLGLGGIKGGLH